MELSVSEPCDVIRVRLHMLSSNFPLHLEHIFSIFQTLGGARSESCPSCWKKSIILGQTNKAIHDPLLNGVCLSTDKQQPGPSVGAGLQPSAGGGGGGKLVKRQTNQYYIVSNWATVCDAGSTLKQHWTSAAYLSSNDLHLNLSNTRRWPNAGLMLV